MTCVGSDHKTRILAKQIVVVLSRDGLGRRIGHLACLVQDATNLRSTLSLGELLAVLAEEVRVLGNLLARGLFQPV